MSVRHKTYLIVAEVVCTASKPS